MEFEENKDRAMKGFNVRNQCLLKTHKNQNTVEVDFLLSEICETKSGSDLGFWKIYIDKNKVSWDNGTSLNSKFILLHIHKNDRKFYTLSFGMDVNL